MHLIKSKIRSSRSYASCIREITASMLKTSQVTGKRSCFFCILAIHGDNYGIFDFTMHINLSPKSADCWYTSFSRSTGFSRMITHAD
jgi:hypothetical protein